MNSSLKVLILVLVVAFTISIAFGLYDKEQMKQINLFCQEQDPIIIEHICLLENSKYHYRELKLYPYKTEELPGHLNRDCEYYKCESYEPLADINNIRISEAYYYEYPEKVDDGLYFIKENKVNIQVPEASVRITGFDPDERESYNRILATNLNDNIIVMLEIEYIEMVCEEHKKEPFVRGLKIKNPYRMEEELVCFTENREQAFSIDSFERWKGEIK